MIIGFKSIPPHLGDRLGLVTDDITPISTKAWGGYDDTEELPILPHS